MWEEGRKEGREGGREGQRKEGGKEDSVMNECLALLHSPF
jgi:hypothetical protein